MQPARARDARLGADFWTTVDAVRTPHRPPINSAMPIIKNGAATAKFVTETRGDCEILTPPLARRPAPPSTRAAVAAIIAMRKTAAALERNARRREPARATAARSTAPFASVAHLPRAMSRRDHANARETPTARAQTSKRDGTDLSG